MIYMKCFLCRDGVILNKLLMRVDVICILLFLFGLTSISAQPKFTVKHGLFVDKDSLIVGIEPTLVGAEIRYTLDGSEPGDNSFIYSKPLVIKSTVVLRAKEYKNGEPSASTTATYLFMDSILSQSNTPFGYPDQWGKFLYPNLEGNAPADYEMDPELITDPTTRKNIIKGFEEIPILSIATDIENLFSHENDTLKGGIYIFTGPPQVDSTGRGWTRFASFELFGKTANLGNSKEFDLTYNCGLRLHGGHSRFAEKTPKHSFRLIFKKDYGVGKIEDAIFGNNSSSPINQLVLHSHFNNSWPFWEKVESVRSQYTRDVWARMVQKQLNHPYSSPLKK